MHQVLLSLHSNTLFLRDSVAFSLDCECNEAGGGNVGSNTW